MLRKEKIFRRGGVTLLEIMLVLAIAAVIIVMSVRYYQSASASQRANACVAYLQAVAAAADSLSEATQSYKDIGADATEISKQIDAIVPRNEAVCNQEGGRTVEGGSSAKYICFNIKLHSEQVCRLMMPALRASGHWRWSSSSTTLLEEQWCSSQYLPADGYICYFRTQL